jgi:hypothetical protein
LQPSWIAAGTDFDAHDVAVSGTSLLQIGNADCRLATVGGSLDRRGLQEGEQEQEASFSMSVETVIPENSGSFPMIVASAARAVTVAVSTASFI